MPTYIVLEDDPAKTTPEAQIGLTALEWTDQGPADLIECLLHTAYACDMDPVDVLIRALTAYQDHVQRTRPEPDLTDQDWRVSVAEAAARVYTALIAPGERFEGNDPEEVLSGVVADTLRLADRREASRTEILARALGSLGDQRRYLFQ